MGLPIRVLESSLFPCSHVSHRYYLGTKGPFLASHLIPAAVNSEPRSIRRPSPPKQNPAALAATRTTMLTAPNDAWNHRLRLRGSHEARLRLCTLR